MPTMIKRLYLLPGLLLGLGVLAATMAAADLAGWNIRTESSGILSLGTNDWLQEEHLSSGTYSNEGTYTAEDPGNGLLQLHARVDADQVREWRFTFATPASGTYTLDYLLLGSFPIHEEGRFYRDTPQVGYAQWLDATGAQAAPARIWEYLTGKTGIPRPTISSNGKLREIFAPTVRPLVVGRIGIEGSLDLKTWSPLGDHVTLDLKPGSQFFRLRAEVGPAPWLKVEPARSIGQILLTPGTPSTLTGFTTIRSLAITPGATTAKAIQVTESPLPPATGQIRPLTGLLGIHGLESPAPEPITVRVNVTVPKDHFAMGFIFDRATGRFEGMPLAELADDHVTVVSRHFCEFLISAIPLADLPDEVDSGYRPGVDDWEFTNHGSYIAPRGHCAGQAVSSMYYYVTERMTGKGPQLNLMWDNPQNDWATPNIGNDNQRGYALASVVQASVDWEGFANRFWRFTYPGDRNTYLCFVYSMWVTGEPQMMCIFREGGGHAITAWKCAFHSVHVADPNYPGNDARWVNFVTQSNLFDPYYSGPTADDLGKAYPTILYYGKTTMIDWNLVSNSWAQAKAGTIGPPWFAAPTLKIINEDETLAGTLTNSMAGGNVTVAVSGDSFALGGKNLDQFRALKPDGTDVPSRDGNRQLDAVTNRVGIELLRKITVGTNVVSKWVGFQWLTLIKQGACGCDTNVPAGFVRKTGNHNSFWHEDANGVKQGPSITYFTDGSHIESEGYYLDGKEQGAWCYGHEDAPGWRYRTTYAGGAENGYWRAWRTNGIVEFDGYYLNDVPDGRWREFNEFGLPSYAQFHTNGIEYRVEWYYPNGQVETSLFKSPNGKWDGAYRTYFEGGEPDAVGQYSQDMQVGVWTWHYRSGGVRVTGAYVGGSESGTWRWYDENGELTAEKDYP